MSLDIIKLHLKTPPEADSEIVGVIIDGRDLVDRLKELEIPFALAEENPRLAGEYLGLAPEEWRIRKPYQDGRSAVLGCECGIVDCWPFLTRILVGEETVTWSDFKQPFRPKWSYAALGTFTFDRAQYLSELAKIGCTAR